MKNHDQGGIGVGRSTGNTILSTSDTGNIIQAHKTSAGASGITKKATTTAAGAGKSGKINTKKVIKK